MIASLAPYGSRAPVKFRPHWRQKDAGPATNWPATNCRQCGRVVYKKYQLCSRCAVSSPVADTIVFVEFGLWKQRPLQHLHCCFSSAYTRRQGSIFRASCCSSSCWGNVFKKAQGSVVSNRIGMKFGRCFPHLNMHRVTESDFWFDATLSKWWPWRHFTQRNATTRWMKKKRLTRAYARSYSN